MAVYEEFKTGTGLFCFCYFLVKNKKIIVFFFDEQKGTVVSSKDRLYKLGEYGEDWEMGFFTPFNGTLTLQND